MKRNDLVGKNGKVEFFSPDGSRYASSCTIAEIMSFPFFRLRVDNWQDYQVHSASSLGASRATEMTASDLEF